MGTREIAQERAFEIARAWRRYRGLLEDVRAARAEFDDLIDSALHDGTRLVDLTTLLGCSRSDIQESQRRRARRAT